MWAWPAGIPTLEIALFPFNGADFLTFATPASASFPGGFSSDGAPNLRQLFRQTSWSLLDRLENEPVWRFLLYGTRGCPQIQPCANFFHFFCGELF
jgi:hypothetical protein